MEFKNKKLEQFEKDIEKKKIAVIGIGVSNIPLIDYLHEKKVAYSKIFSERPTLNDVFLELTGKDLRDWCLNIILNIL